MRTICMQQCPEYEQYSVWRKFELWIDNMNCILRIFTIRKNMFNMQQKVVFIWFHLIAFI